MRLCSSLSPAQCDGVDMLIDAHEGKTKHGFASVALRILRDERTSCPVAEIGCRARIDHGRPDQITGKSDAMAKNGNGAGSSEPRAPRGR